MDSKPTKNRVKQTPDKIGGNPSTYFLMGEKQEISTNTMVKYLTALENKSGNNRISPYEIKSEVKKDFITTADLKEGMDTDHLSVG